MPVLSVFYGLIIRMYAEGGGKHHTPHIHVIYQNEEYQFDFDGNELNGKTLVPQKRNCLTHGLYCIVTT